MKKIMFNDRYGLTQAVIEGRKTMAMMLINIKSTSDVQVRIFAGYVQIIGRSGDVCAEKKLSYKVGEVVAWRRDIKIFSTTPTVSIRMLGKMMINHLVGRTRCLLRPS